MGLACFFPASRALLGTVRLLAEAPEPQQKVPPGLRSTLQLSKIHQSMMCGFKVSLTQQLEAGAHMAGPPAPQRVHRGLAG